MVKVLFIAMHRPNRSPSQRFRFEQYFEFLEANGIICHLSYLITAKQDKMLYSPGKYFKKFGIFIQSIMKRVSDLESLKYYDYVFIQREAFMTGSTFFERRLAKSGKPVIFDFDDSIWLQDKGEHNGVAHILKNPEKTSKIINYSSLIIAGNQYLADYASEYNTNVKIIPTTIDTTIYNPDLINKEQGKSVIIGWSGSFTTIKHFKTLEAVLIKIKQKFEAQVGFMVIGDGNYQNEELGITGMPWKSATEIQDLGKIDIGIMPLPDDDWSKGKCGLKGLQYMGMAIPTIMSPVGVNTDIIEDGVNGFLARSDEEWIEKLSLLIESADLREKLGKAGRQTVVEKYSVEANKDKYLELFGN